MKQLHILFEKVRMPLSTSVIVHFASLRKNTSDILKTLWGSGAIKFRVNWWFQLRIRLTCKKVEADKMASSVSIHFYIWVLNCVELKL